MPAQTQHPRRKSPRLQAFDYAQDGAYFITICTHQRRCLFGQIDDNGLKLNDAGQIATNCWDEIPVHYPTVTLDSFVVMPNHIHGILLLSSGQSHIRNENLTIRLPALGTIIGSYKATVTRMIRRANLDMQRIIWQERFYDHIIRNHTDGDRIRNYIATNPGRWREDSLYSEFV